MGGYQFESYHEKTFSGKCHSWRPDAILGGQIKIVHADGASNNEVIVNDGSYSINGTTYTYTGNFDALSQAGSTWAEGVSDTEDANNNTFTFYGGTISGINLEYIFAGFSYYGNVRNNTLNLYGGEFPITEGFTGGAGKGNATNNTINIGTKIYFGDVEYQYFTAGHGVNATGNTINVTDGADINVSSGENDIRLRAGGTYEYSEVERYVANNSINVTGGTLAVHTFTAGLSEGHGTVENNSINISAGNIKALEIDAGIFYAPTDSALIRGNKVNITGGNVSALDENSFLGINGGSINVTGEGGTITNPRVYYDGGTADSNEVNLSDGNVTVGDLTGGMARIATNNKINVTGGTQNLGLINGGLGVDEASGNEVNISTGTIINVTGGASIYGDATNNTVNLSGGTINGNIFGGSSGSGSANNNVVNISDSENIEFEAYYTGINGGYGNTADNNEINISGGTINLTAYGIIRGGYGNTSATANTVNITGGNVNAYVMIGGGYGTVENNTVNISNGTVNMQDDVRGGEGDTVNNNTVNISGGTVTASNIVGGVGENVTNNTVNITGGIINGDVLGGKGTSSITNNTINIYNAPNLTNAYLYGYGTLDSESTPTISGNTLNIYTKDLTAKNVADFQNINFYLPSNTVNGDTILTLTDEKGTNLSSTDITAVMQGGSNLTYGDSVTLLTNANGVTAAKSYGTLKNGVSLNYEMNISPVGNSVVANITKSPNSLNPEANILSKGVDKTTVGAITTSLDTPTIENIGGSTETEDSTVTVQESVNVPIVEPKGWEIFANMGGGSLKFKAGDGSYVDMTSQSINLGFARSLENSAGRFTIAPIIDYVSGNYDSYLETGVHGSGKTRYIAGGLIMRRMLPNGFYYEGSVRVGKVKTDFSSDNIDKSGVFGKVTYDTSATTLAGHLKLGKAFRLNKNNFLDVYGIYYHAHQGSMDADLSSGEHYNFSSANAGRARIGYRLTTRTSKISQIYTGLAYQYEHNTGVTATYKTYSTAGAGDSGSSGMLELGWIIKPLKALPWAVDINTTGWIGYQRGITAMAKIQKSF